MYAFVIVGFFKCSKNYLSDIHRDFKANSTLSFVDFFEIRDSIACDIASKPDEAFKVFPAFKTNSGIIIK